MQNKAREQMVGIALIVMLAACGGATEAAKPEIKPVLPRIEAYVAPTDPKVFSEAYDVIDLTNKALAAGIRDAITRNAVPTELPPTKADVLLQDLRRASLFQLSLPKLDPKTVDVATLKKVIDFYATTPYEKIPGYRPWTHKNFITALSEAERAQLAEEAVAHLRAKGFLGPDELPDAPPPKAPEAPVVDPNALPRPVMSPWGRDPKLIPGSLTKIYGKLGYIEHKETQKDWQLLAKLDPPGKAEEPPAGDSCPLKVGDKVNARYVALYKKATVTEVHGKYALLKFSDYDGWRDCVADIKPPK